MKEGIIPRLIIKRKKGDEEFPLQKKEIRIGRGRDCDIVLNSPYASRLHTIIRREGERFLAIDNSRSGTYVQGKRLDNPMYLIHNDKIRVEDTTIIFRDPNATKVRSSKARRTAGTSKTKLVVVSDTRQVIVGDRKLGSQLSSHEFDLLHFLYRNRGRACSREEMIDAIWENWRKGDRRYETNRSAHNALYQLVHRLRQKIEPVPNQPRYILTVPNYGYRLHFDPKED